MKGSESMNPRHWNHRTVNVFMNQVNKNLEDMMITMDRVKSIIQEAQKMKPVWQQLRNSIREPERTMNTKAYTKEKRSKRRKR